MTDLDPLSQLQAEEQISRLSNELTNHVVVFQRAAEEAAKADVAYKRAYAEGMIERRGKGGTLPEKDAEITVAVIAYYEKRALTEAVFKAAKFKGEALVKQLEAVRSINANVRHAVDYSRGRGG